MSVKRSPQRSSSFSEGSLPASSGAKFIFKAPLLGAKGGLTAAVTSAAQEPATVAQKPATAEGSPKKAPKTLQVGMDRYLPKRKLSPQLGNPAIEETEPKAPKSQKPPPIYLREESSNALVKKLTELIGKGTFHIVPIKRGQIHETKIQVYSEGLFRVITKHLGDNNKNYYTYRLKSSKGRVVVIKGIEPNVDPAEIKEALELLGFSVHSVFNIFNREKSHNLCSRLNCCLIRLSLKKTKPTLFIGWSSCSTEKLL